MNVTMVERNCADCLLRMLASGRCQEAEAEVQDLEPESATEQQLVLLERRYGPNWKW